MREKPGKKDQLTHYAQDQKRSLIDSLEALRGARGCGRAAQEERLTLVKTEEPTVPALQQEVLALREELHNYRSTNAILENDLRRMEQKALDTIAENGQLKQCLDKLRQNGQHNADADAEERSRLVAELAQARNDHFMLTQALIDSENELSRLTRMLEKLAGRLCAA